ncbi:MAG TPA: hypothetical protein VHZ24_17495 [Pirellulales bacterium]|jgi:mono/diheme cytochrome c family protein|nr:hypothetical protein [Pirellulales bacterium]
MLAVAAWSLFASQSFAAEPVTYSKHVAKILWTHCAACHRAGAVGPFSLLTYDDAAKRAEHLVEVTASRRMPPWHADPDYGEFLDERRLSDDELATLRAWAEAGAPAGDPADLPPEPEFPDGWQLGEPDLVIRMAEPFQVAADGADVYRCFVLPILVPENKMVAAVEFKPGNPRAVHHALFFLDKNGLARKLDAEDELQGYASFGGIRLIPSGMLGGWAPGGTPRWLPESTGRFLRQGSDLIMQVHYHPDGKPETDQSEVAIHFVKSPATRLVADLPLMNRNISIPPGEKQHKVSLEFVMPVEIEALGITPHMHLVGRQMRATAYFPDGTQRPLIWVPDWDFNWQIQYLFREPITLTKGTRIKVEAQYDNSTDNPRNPNHPPRWVGNGEQTSDEMCLCSITFAIEDRKAYGRLMDDVVRMHLPFLQAQELFRDGGGGK